jgi:hypothetical protein
MKVSESGSRLMDALCSEDHFGAVQTYQPKLMALMHVARAARRRLLPEIDGHERFLARGGDDTENEGLLNTQVRRAPPIQVFFGALMELTGISQERLEAIMANRKELYWEDLVDLMAPHPDFDRRSLVLQGTKYRDDPTPRIRELLELSTTSSPKG